MRSIEALRDGIARVDRAPVILACVFVVTLLAALPFSMVMRDELQAHLGDSLVAEQVARGVNVQWWSEFTAQAGTLGKTFQPGIIGFAAVLDNLSAFADGDGAPFAARVARCLLSPVVAVSRRWRARPLCASAPYASSRVLRGLRHLFRAFPAAGAVHRAVLLRAVRRRASHPPGRCVLHADARRKC